tara:strand:+ start:182 stop:550 length:369 start_codon:yes stop_codon:yes gene_type:complete
VRFGAAGSHSATIRSGDRLYYDDHYWPFTVHDAVLNIGFDDGIWLTITSLTTVVYGDLSAARWKGQTATALIIYFGGIFVAGKFAGDFFDYRSARRAAMKLGDWNYPNLTHHIVVLGSERHY